MSRDGKNLDAMNRAKLVGKGSAWLRGFAGLTILAGLGLMAGELRVQSQVPQYNGGLPGVERSSSGMPGLPENANPRPDGLRALRDSLSVEDRSKMIKMLNVQRQKDMNTDTGRLVTLANEVKLQASKVGPDGKERITVLDLHKVEMIEKLAKGVREKMTAVSATD